MEHRAAASADQRGAAGSYFGGVGGASWEGVERPFRGARQDRRQERGERGCVWRRVARGSASSGARRGCGRGPARRPSAGTRRCASEYAQDGRATRSAPLRGPGATHKRARAPRARHRGPRGNWPRQRRCAAGRARGGAMEDETKCNNLWGAFLQKLAPITSFRCCCAAGRVPTRASAARVRLCGLGVAGRVGVVYDNPLHNPLSTIASAAEHTPVALNEQAPGPVSEE